MGDQYLGRVVSGLDVNDVSFANSPPYFDNADGDKREKILSFVEDYKVRGHYMTGDMYYLFYFCFASLCYHFEFLVQNLPQQSKLQASIFFNNITNYAKKSATVKFPWNKMAATPTFTGLLPHVCILAKLEGLKVELHWTKNQIIDGVKKDLDGRCLGSQSYFDKEEIIAKMGKLHNELLHKVEVVGRRSSTLQQGSIEDLPGIAVGMMESNANEIANALTIVDPDGGEWSQFFQENPFTCFCRLCFPPNDIMHAHHKLVLWE